MTSLRQATSSVLSVNEADRLAMTDRLYVFLALPCSLANPPNQVYHIPGIENACDPTFTRNGHTPTRCD